MEYDKKYKKAMDTILNIIEKNKDNFNNLPNNQIIKNLYDNINAGINYVDNLDKNNKLIQSRHHNDAYSKPYGKFVPKNIKNFITSHNNSHISITSNLLGRLIKINFFLYKHYSIEYIKNNAKNVLSWLYVCNKYTYNNCSKTLTINIFLCEYEKKMPVNGGVLGPNNINSGYSGVCWSNNEIMIYRKEEWFKVFLHESMHAFNLQPSSNSDNYILNKLHEIFAISANISIVETYVEIWARIINSMYSGIFNSNNYEEFLSLFRFNLRVESLFSYIQAIRVLDYMNLNFDDILNKNDDNARLKYKENTNVFAYIILTAILMKNPYLFMEWCNKNNTNILKYDNTVKNNNRFMKLLTKAVKENKRQFLKYQFFKDLNIGLRFTIINTV